MVWGVFEFGANVLAYCDSLWPLEGQRGGALLVVRRVRCGRRRRCGEERRARVFRLDGVFLFVERWFRGGGWLGWGCWCWCWCCSASSCVSSRVHLCHGFWVRCRCLLLLRSLRVHRRRACCCCRHLLRIRSMLCCSSAEEDSRCCCCCC
jgi:hypothetical protein